MSSAGKSLALRAKRLFAKDYPDVAISINSREGWIIVDGKKAVNLSQASGRPLSMEDVIDKMKQAYLGHSVQENTMKLTKRQLKKIIKEEKKSLLTESAYVHDIFKDAAVALEMRDGDKLTRLSGQMDGLLMPDRERNAYVLALDAMTEAAYELASYEEEDGY